MIDEEQTRTTAGGLLNAGKVRPCMGADVETGRLYIFDPTLAPAVKWQGRVYVVVKERDLQAEVL